MTPLTQQLEDKKKEYKQLYNSNHKNFPNSNVCRTCAKMNRCQAEIAILEQAIAEIEKRDKDEIELLKTIEKWICKVTPKMQLDNEILREVCPNIFYNCENRIEQLQSQQLKVEVSESEKIVRGTPRADSPQNVTGKENN